MPPASPVPEKKDRARIPSLDGLRAVSITLVLLGHLAGTRYFLPHWHPLGILATFGVRVFFVISGFLITSLLIDEEARTGTVSLGHFYLRRTLRIFPPFYAFLAVMAVASAIGWVRLQRFDLLAALTYTTNYHHERGWDVGHAWSLAVEEQFYLLWPLLFKLLGSARVARVALGAVILCPLLRFGLLVASPTFHEGLGETFPTIADSMAMGCLLACYRSRIDAWPRLSAWLRSDSAWLAPALAIAASFISSAKVINLVGQSLTNLGIAVLIARVVRHPEDRAGRVLNARPFVFVGVLSYSLYLWQQPFLNHLEPGMVRFFPLNLVLAVAVGWLSYRFVERPALRFRSYLEARLRRAPAPLPEAGPGPAPPAPTLG